MEPIRWDDRPLHGYIAGQVGIGAPNPRVGVAFQRGIKVHDLHDAVHTRISTASAERGDALCGKFGEGSFQLILHGLARELALPALVGLSVVADT